MGRKKRYWLNITNHPSEAWSEAQQQAALELAEEIEDVPFPEVAPSLSGEEVYAQARAFADELFARYGANGWKALVQGEFAFTLALVSILMRAGIPCYCATTERIVETDAEGRIIRRFRFVRFREYVLK